MKNLSGVTTSHVLVFLHTWEMDSCAHVVSIFSLLHAVELNIRTGNDEMRYREMKY